MPQGERVKATDWRLPLISASELGIMGNFHRIALIAAENVDRIALFADEKCDVTESAERKHSDATLLWLIKCLPPSKPRFRFHTLGTFNAGLV